MFWQTVKEFKSGDYDIIIDIMPDDTPLDMMFDDSICDIDELIRQVNDYEAYWSIVRARAFLKGRELGSSVLWGVYHYDTDELDDIIPDLESEAVDEAEEFMNEICKRG